MNKEFLALTACFVLFVASLFLIVGVPTYFFIKAGCTAQAGAMGIGHEFGFFKGCIYTLKDGRKIDSDHYIVNDSNK